MAVIIVCLALIIAALAVIATALALTELVLVYVALGLAAIAAVTLMAEVVRGVIRPATQATRPPSRPDVAQAARTGGMGKTPVRPRFAAATDVPGPATRTDAPGAVSATTLSPVGPETRPATSRTPVTPHGPHPSERDSGTGEGHADDPGTAWADHAAVAPHRGDRDGAAATTEPQRERTPSPDAGSEATAPATALDAPCDGATVPADVSPPEEGDRAAAQGADSEREAVRVATGAVGVTPTEHDSDSPAVASAEADTGVESVEGNTDSAAVEGDGDAPETAEERRPAPAAAPEPGQPEEGTGPVDHGATVPDTRRESLREADVTPEEGADPVEHTSPRSGDADDAG